MIKSQLSFSYFISITRFCCSSTLVVVQLSCDNTAHLSFLVINLMSSVELWELQRKSSQHAKINTGALYIIYIVI